ncbi:MAG: beta-galactosidase [SAR202 cluster bacterium]|nr:beta-galactosidase [SAR202 cluster bacterium]
MSHSPQSFIHPETPFPVGVEYYRGGTPKSEVWNEDFARIRASGFKIVRTASYWNWMEPYPGIYKLDDFDQLMDTAAEHSLSVWMDIMLATHGACPEWLTRENPDMCAVNWRGQPMMPDAQPAYSQGGMIHCYDHPIWRERGGDLLRHVINRYKNHPALHVWGIWDGINLSSAWVDQGNGYPCYCENTLSRWKLWLQNNFTLEEFNKRVQRRFPSWDYVEPPRSNNNVVEMLVYRQFHYENLASHLKWMVGVTKEIDSIHETRTHGAWFPRPWDEICAMEADSWGMSMPSNDLLTSRDPMKIAERAFAFDWSRSIGREGRWWNEEIYSGMAKGGVTWKKQSEPEELTALLWMTLAYGAAGAMFWQYRPDYLAFESPGYNLMAPDGRPTPRSKAVTAALKQIESISEHLPLEIVQAEVAIVVDSTSQDIFTLNDEGDRFLADLRGVYRTLWQKGIPVDLLTPRMDWSGYKLLFLPNVTVMTAQICEKIQRTLIENADTHIVAEGSFGMYAYNGISSYNPPDGLANSLGIRVADFSRVTEYDIEQGANVLETTYGPVTITSPTGYAVLEGVDKTAHVATLGGKPVAMTNADQRLTWYAFNLSAGFSDIGDHTIISGILGDVGVNAPIASSDPEVVPVTRKSVQGGSLLFLFNTSPEVRSVSLDLLIPATKIFDLLGDRELDLLDGTFGTEIAKSGVGVFSIIDN